MGFSLKHIFHFVNVAKNFVVNHIGKPIVKVAEAGIGGFLGGGGPVGAAAAMIGAGVKEAIRIGEPLPHDAQAHEHVGGAVGTLALHHLMADHPGGGSRIPDNDIHSEVDRIMDKDNAETFQHIEHHHKEAIRESAKNCAKDLRNQGINESHLKPFEHDLPQRRAPKRH